MTSSLVGSEMCIRDRSNGGSSSSKQKQQGRNNQLWKLLGPGSCMLSRSVSYTHLTLPTICSV
eukprot:11002248-Prorocentrum_lima.AAC.1